MEEGNRHFGKIAEFLVARSKKKKQTQNTTLNRILIFDTIVEKQSANKFKRKLLYIK